MFPCYQDCQYRNRNGTIKKIECNRGEICVVPVHTVCWRKTKKKYLRPKVYHTRYQRKLYEKRLFLASLFNQQLLHPKYEYYRLFCRKPVCEKVLIDPEIDVIKKCYYCKSCKKYDKFYSIKSELGKKGFFTFNKH